MTLPWFLWGRVCTERPPSIQYLPLNPQTHKCNHEPANSTTNPLRNKPPTSSHPPQQLRRRLPHRHRRSRLRIAMAKIRWLCPTTQECLYPYMRRLFPRANPPLLSAHPNDSTPGVKMPSKFRHTTAIPTSRPRRLNPTHHSPPRELGASHAFDYREGESDSLHLSSAPASTEAAANSTQEAQRCPPIPFMVDCVGSRKGSLAPLAQIAQRGGRGWFCYRVS